MRQRAHERTGERTDMTRILAAFLGGIALVGLAALGVSIVVGVILLLIRLGAPAKHPMVAGALSWLGESLDREAGVWWIVGPEVNDAPHAPWWTWSAEIGLLGPAPIHESTVDMSPCCCNWLTIPGSPPCFSIS